MVPQLPNDCIMARLGYRNLWALLTLGILLHLLEGAEKVELNEQVKNLTNKQLQTIPYSDPNSTVTTLLLSGNQIQLNESDRLALASYSGLTQLYLDKNVVRNIKAKYFTQVPGLTVLSLSGNKISRLDPEAFSGLDSLTQLDLSNNSLTIYPYQLWKTLNLQVLNVEGNPWNCSCEVLLNLTQGREDRTFSLASNATCVSPQSMLGLDLSEATIKCLQAPTPSITKVPTPEISTILKPALTVQLNDSRSQDQPVAVQSNSWKFTVSVVALGLTTAVLIVCAIKGPSWYKLFHNYRHRRLHDEPMGTTVFHQTPRQQHTYTFEQEGGHQRRTEEEEEDEDGYFEDPYIRRED